MMRKNKKRKKNIIIISRVRFYQQYVEDINTCLETFFFFFYPVVFKKNQVNLFLNCLCS